MHRLSLRGAVLLVMLCFVATFARAQQPPLPGGTLSLTLTRTGARWSATARAQLAGQEFANPVRALKVGADSVVFAMEVGGADTRFTGKRAPGGANDKLEGTFEAIVRGQRIAAGTWSLTRAAGSGSDLAGTWTGTLQATEMTPLRPQPPRADPAFKTNVARPAYTRAHPRVLFDEAHRNAETMDGRYKALAPLLRSDGYQVAAGKTAFGTDALRGVAVLVVANASGPAGQPAQAAFTDTEGDAVRDWVRAGGSLLLIADPYPRSASAQALAERFGVNLRGGETVEMTALGSGAGGAHEHDGTMVFTRDNGLLADHPITRGRNAAERVARVQTFGAQSLKGPASSVALLSLTAIDVDALPDILVGENDPATLPVTGRTPLLAMPFGKGRVVVLGDADLLVAQIDPNDNPVGMNVPGCDNRQLALNLFHWLSGLLPAPK